MTREEFTGEINLALWFQEFHLVENKRSARPDLHAFLLLDELQPGTRQMIKDAYDNEFSLDIDIEELVTVITLNQVVELRQCGVLLDDSEENLVMFT